MLALSIALLRRPKLLLVDEPSLGLAPMVVREIYDTFSRIRRSGTSIVIVEQFVHMVLGLADRVYLLNKGGLVFSGEPEQLGKDASGEQQHLMGAYLGTQGLEVATERRRSVATEQVKLPLPVTFVRALEDHAAREGLTLAQVVAASMDQIMSGVPSNGQGGMRG
jgi:ABC-type multidrug transport system ATPase subunit